jgi:hypothetical protein
MTENTYRKFVPGPDSFGTKGRIITPGAGDLDPLAKAVVCLTTGDITVLPNGNADGDTIAFTGVAAGYIVPFRVRRVTAATATVASIED